MTALVRRHIAVLYCILASWLVFAPRALADDKSMACDTRPPAVHASLAENDQNSANHLQLSRKLGLDASIDLDVCAAEVRIVGSNNDQLQVTVDIESPAPKMTAADYLQTLDVSPQTAKLQFHLLKSLRAKVVIAVPAKITRLKADLVNGSLSLETDRIRGDRTINVVHGNVELLANADAYSTLHVDTVMGSFRDHRKGGEEHHFMVSQSLSGTGTGSVAINVVMGSVDIKAWD